MLRRSLNLFPLSSSHSGKNPPPPLPTLSKRSFGSFLSLFRRARLLRFFADRFRFFHSLSLSFSDRLPKPNPASVSSPSLAVPHGLLSTDPSSSFPQFQTSPSSSSSHPVLVQPSNSRIRLGDPCLTKLIVNSHDIALTLSTVFACSCGAERKHPASSKTNEERKNSTEASFLPHFFPQQAKKPQYRTTNEN